MPSYCSVGSSVRCVFGGLAAGGNARCTSSCRTALIRPICVHHALLRVISLWTSQTHPVFLGGVERFEDPIQVRREYAAAVIADRKLDMTRRSLTGRNADASPLRWQPIHGVYGIENQIEKNLLQLDDVPFYLRQRAAKLSSYGNRFVSA